jgi:hypothetical protein
MPDYRDTIYTNLLSAYGKDNLPDKATFNSKLDNDPAYAKTIYTNLYSAYGKDNLPQETDFYIRVKPTTPQGGSKDNNTISESKLNADEYSKKSVQDADPLTKVLGVGNAAPIIPTPQADFHELGKVKLSLPSFGTGMNLSRLYEPNYTTVPELAKKNNTTISDIISITGKDKKDLSMAESMDVEEAIKARREGDKEAGIGGSIMIGVSQSNAHVFKLLSSVDNMLKEATGYVTGEKVGEKNIFDDWANYSENVAASYGTPKGIVQEAVAGTIGMTSDLLGIAIAPELKIAAGAIIPKMGTYFAANNFAITYGNLLKNNPDELNVLSESIKSAGKGLEDGLILHGLGYASNMFGNKVLQATANKFYQGVASVGANALGFMGLTAAEGGTPTNIAASGLMGGILGIPQLAGGLYGESVNAAKTLYSKAATNFETATIQDVQKVQDIPFSLQDIRKLEISLKEKADNTSDITEKHDLMVKSIIFGNMADVEAIRQIVVANPTEFKKSVETSDLTPEEKQSMFQKVDNIVANSDNRVIESKSIEANILELSNKITEIDNNTAYSPIQKEYLKKPITNSIMELEQQINNTFSQPAKPKEAKDITDFSNKILGNEVQSKEPITSQEKLNDLEKQKAVLLNQENVDNISLQKVGEIEKQIDELTQTIKTETDTKTADVTAQINAIDTQIKDLYKGDLSELEIQLAGNKEAELTSQKAELLKERQRIKNEVRNAIPEIVVQPAEATTPEKTLETAKTGTVAEIPDLIKNTQEVIANETTGGIMPLVNASEKSVPETDFVNKRKERKRIFLRHLLDNEGDVDGAFSKAGYVNNEGFWIEPGAEKQFSQLSSETKEILKKHGVKFIDNSLDNINGHATGFQDGNNLIKGIGLSFKGEHFIGTDFTALHELGHMEWESLPQEIKDLFNDNNPITEHGKGVKSGKFESTYGKDSPFVAEEDFAELFAENKGNIEQTIKAKKEVPQAQKAKIPSEAIPETVASIEGAITPETVELDKNLSKYGWSSKTTEKGIELINRDGKTAAIIKGDINGKYKIVDGADNVLLSGKGQIGKSAEKVAVEYFYADFTTSPEPLVIKGKKVVKETPLAKSDIVKVDYEDGTSGAIGKSELEGLKQKTEPVQPEVKQEPVQPETAKNELPLDVEKVEPKKPKTSKLKALTEAEKAKKTISKEKEAVIVQSIADRLVRLSNVKELISDSEKPQILEDLIGLVTDAVKLGEIKLEQGIDYLKTKLPNLKNFIEENKDEIIKKQKTGLSGIKKELVSDEALLEVNLNKMSDTEMYKIGKQLNDSGEVKSRDVIEEIAGGNHRALQPKEVVALIAHKVGLDTKLDVTYDKITKAKNEGADATELTAQATLLEKQIQDYEAMSIITAQQQSLAFRLRKGLLNRKYELQEQIRKYKAKSKDGTIPAEIEKIFRETDAKLKEVRKQLNIEREKVKAFEEQNAESNIKAEAARNKKIKTKQNLESSADEFIKSKTFKDWITESKGGIDQLIEQTKKDLFASSYGQMSALTPVVQLAHMSKLVTLYMAKGGLKFAEAVDSVYNEFKDAIKDLKKEDIENHFNTFIKEQKEGLPTIKKDKITIPTSFLSKLINEGKTTIQEWTTEAHKILSKDKPDITETEVRDAITKYGKKANPTRSEIQTQILEQKNIGKLVSKIENVINKKEAPTVSVTRKRILSDKERQLTKELNQLLDETGLADIKRLRDIAKRKIKKIRDLTERLSTNNYEKGRYNTSGEFVPFIKKSNIINDRVRKLESEEIALQEIYETNHYAHELRNRSGGEKARDYLIEGYASTRVIAGVDLSAMMIQGLVMGVIRPQHVPKAFIESMKQLASENKHIDFMNKLKTTDFYRKIKISGGYLGESGVKFIAREEQFQGEWINHIWNFLGRSTVGIAKNKSTISAKTFDIWKTLNPYKAGQRAFLGYINMMRLQAYNTYFSMLERNGKTIENDIASYKAAASWVNNTSMRGKLFKKLEGAADVLTLAMFSPRKVAANINILNPRYYLKMWMRSPIMAKRAIRDMLQFMGTVSMTFAMAQLAGKLAGNDEDVVELNTRSSNALKIKIGNKHIDILAGFAQVVVASSRLIFGELKNKEGEIITLGQGYNVPTRKDILYRYFESKAAPSTGVALRLLGSRIDEEGVRTDPFGEEISLKNEIARNTLPMWTQNMREIYEEGDPLVNSGLLFLSVLGANVNVPINTEKREAQRQYDKETKPVKELSMDEQNAKYLKQYREDSVKQAKDARIDSLKQLLYEKNN